MAQKDARTIQAELAQPFAPEDLEWRLQRTFASNGETVGIAVPFVTNRAIMNRLDSVVGPENWYNEYKPWHAAEKKEAQICGISIYFEDRGFITKWDGAEDSDIEPIKGGLSDSMKRAAVQWGIGRVLYNMDTVFVDVEQRGRSWIIKKSARPKLDKAYTDMLKALNLKPAPAGGIQSLLTAQDGPEEASQAPQKTGKPAIPPKDGASPQGAPAQKRSTPAIPPRDTAPAAKDRQAPAEQPQPSFAYTVIASSVQKGMNTTHTLVKLKNTEGREISAFAQGEHPLLAPGTLLADAKVSVRKQDTVVYYILESYQIAEPRQRAA